MIYHTITDKEVLIKRNNKGDTRTAKEIPSIEEFDEANRWHIENVSDAMDTLAGIMISQGANHDYTKIKYLDEFYHDFCEVLNVKKEGISKDFTNMKWYKDIHIEKESHHISSKMHDDITLIDVIEMIVDCVCAGKARSDDGSYYIPELPENALELAFKNTVKLVDFFTKVEE